MSSSFLTHLFFFLGRDITYKTPIAVIPMRKTVVFKDIVPVTNISGTIINGKIASVSTFLGPEKMDPDKISPMVIVDSVTIVRIFTVYVYYTLF